MPKVKKQTTCCVYCGKPAKFWCGHVLLGKEKCFAGWCGWRHYDIQGFRGHVQEWMPLEAVPK